jgi:peptidoglycan-associated lipoprotein
MRYRTFVTTALAAVLLVGACSKDPPPPPVPTGPSQAELDSIEALRQAELEAARLEALRLQADKDAAAAAAAALAEARSALTEMVHFDYDVAEISPQAERILRSKLNILRDSPSVMIRVEGHCDNRGSNEYNDALGNRRAQAVVDFFTNFGLDASRFSIVSFGEDRPLGRGESESAWAENRRAQFVITAGQNDINVGGTP